MKNKDYVLYLDLDGVLVAFENGYKKITQGVDFKRIEAMYGEEAAKEQYYKWGVQFWSNMGWESGGKELYKVSKDLFEHVAILSSAGTTDPLKGKMVADGKKMWINKNIPDMDLESVFIVPGKEYKIEYANKGAILVDDMPITIKRWNSAGGFGILHNSSHYRKTIEDLEDIARPIKISELVRRIFWKP